MSVLMCFADVRREVGSVAELDEVLDRLAVDGQPILVQLISGAAAMNLGVGLRDAAVVLFRDASGRAWFGHSGEGLSVAIDAELEFADNGMRYRFFGTAAVHPSQMRKAAREFVRVPGARPSVVDWTPEGIGADVVDGGENGS